MFSPYLKNMDEKNINKILFHVGLKMFSSYAK